MTDLVLKELRFQHARYDLAAEKLRAKWRNAVSTTPGAASLGRQVKAMQARADDYAALVKAAEERKADPA